MKDGKFATEWTDAVNKCAAEFRAMAHKFLVEDDLPHFAILVAMQWTVSELTYMSLAVALDEHEDEDHGR